MKVYEAVLRNEPVGVSEGSAGQQNCFLEA